MFQDPLQHLPLERWSELQSAFKADWPRSITGYTVLESQRNLRKKGVDYGFTVYCPFGDVWNGMVAINEKDQFYEVIILCPRDDTEKLEDALKKTKLINWERSIIVPFAPENVTKCIQKSLEDEMEVILLRSETFVLSEQKIFEDVSLPPSITFGLLSSEYLELVNSTWAHRYPTSCWYFQFLIDNKSGYGLFEDKDIVAWVFFNESGTLLHMYTVEGHRRKGYAEILLKLVSNILLKEHKPVYAFCLKDNLKACNLYTKLGFVKSKPTAWCYLRKK